MVESKLDPYIQKIINSLRDYKYSDNDIRTSFLNVIPHSNKQNIIFLILCYIVTLNMAIFFTISLTFGSMFMGDVAVSVPSYLISLFLLALITYYCFSAFNIKESTILILTGSISLLASIVSLVISFVVIDLIKNLIIIPEETTPGMMNMFADPINPFIMITIIIIAYNILPVIFLLKDK